MLVATGLVLMMTIPALALLNCGMVRKKNVLSTMGQSFVAMALVSNLWAAFGYNLAFTGNGAVIGEAQGFFLSGIGMNSISPFATTIPEILFMAYQMTFAVYYCRDHCGGGRRADELFSLPLLLRALADLRLCPDCTLGVGRRFS